MSLYDIILLSSLNSFYLYVYVKSLTVESKRKNVCIRYVRHQLLSIRIWQDISKASQAMKYVVGQIAQKWNMKQQSIGKKITVNNNFISHMSAYFSDKKKKDGIKRYFLWISKHRNMSKIHRRVYFLSKLRIVIEDWYIIKGRCEFSVLKNMHVFTYRNMEEISFA